MIVRVTNISKKRALTSPRPSWMRKKRAIRSVSHHLPTSSSAASSPSSIIKNNNHLLMSSLPPFSSSASASRFTTPFTPLMHCQGSFAVESSSSSCHTSNPPRFSDDDDEDEELQSTASRPCTPTTYSIPDQSRVSPSPPPPGFTIPTYYKPRIHAYYCFDDEDDEDDEELKSTADSCFRPLADYSSSLFTSFPLPMYRQPTCCSPPNAAAVTPSAFIC